MDKLFFLKQFIAAPSRIGAVMPSSRALADLMVETAGVNQAQVAVEFGPGTGAITESIVEALPPDGSLLAMEVCGEFIEELERRFPNVSIIHDSAARTAEHLAQAGHSHCDCIVSGLPWAAFPKSLQDELLDAVEASLKPGGRFVTFAYLQGVILPAGKAFLRKLKQRFGTVDRTRVVWRNVPPAFVYCVANPGPCEAPH